MSRCVLVRLEGATRASRVSAACRAVTVIRGSAGSFARLGGPFQVHCGCLQSGDGLLPLQHVFRFITGSTLPLPATLLTWAPLQRGDARGMLLTFEMVRAGLHCSFKISRQILPLLLIFGWKTLVRKATCKALERTIEPLVNEPSTQDMSKKRTSWRQKPTSGETSAATKLQDSTGKPEEAAGSEASRPKVCANQTLTLGGLKG